MNTLHFENDYSIRYVCGSWANVGMADREHISLSLLSNRLSSPQIVSDMFYENSRNSSRHITETFAGLQNVTALYGNENHSYFVQMQFAFLCSAEADRCSQPLHNGRLLLRAFFSLEGKSQPYEVWGRKHGALTLLCTKKV